jgi:hypothetical protein
LFALAVLTVTSISALLGDLVISSLVRLLISLVRRCILVAILAPHDRIGLARVENTRLRHAAVGIDTGCSESNLFAGAIVLVPVVVLYFNI